LKKFGNTLGKILSRFLYKGKGFIKGMAITLGGLPKEGIHIFYGYDRFPNSEKVSQGGIIKFQRLNVTYPNTPRRFNILYLGSSNRPPFAEQIYRFARRKGAKFVWNQNGVAYPAWMPSGWEDVNAQMAEFLHSADYVFYQSEFARSCADRFLGKRTGPSEILYNAVDTKIFYPPAKSRNSNSLKLLVMGSQYHTYPLESSLRALAHINKSIPFARMTIAGKIWDHVLNPVMKLITDLGLENHVRFVPPFTQNEALGIFHQSDILLHTKIQDVCPGVVIEAMSCGVPVVYSSSGGVPELVGKYSGVGVSTSANWEVRIPPEPSAWADAVLAVAEDLIRYRKAARQRAVELFDYQLWQERHRQVFTELLEDRAKPYSVIPTTNQKKN
jgi:glycosyltransferase involved in cell wall biosynthesis